ncbi:MAG: alpha-L-rhamnosidase N-terminal domain-containing protein, partial [Novosphingobium sp.]
MTWVDFRVADWVARPVSPVGNVDRPEPCPVPYLRRRFTADGQIARAVLAVSALGVHETTINGTPISPNLFDPGWTEYRHRLLYSAYDVTALIQTGENVLAAAVGDGWWRGNLTWMKRRAVYGSTTALLAQLEIEYSDGKRQIVATDEYWKGATGGLLEADFYNGCELDLRSEPLGWRDQGFDDSGWEGVSILPLPAGLELRSAPAVRIVKQFEVA